MGDPNRRSFLKWATHGLGAVFGAIFGIPIVAFLIDPRHRAQARADDSREIDGIDLAQLALNRPQQGVIRSVRNDAWTLYPNDVLGRVWVTLHKEFPDRARTDPNLNMDSAQLVEYVKILSTTCPHLGCFVNVRSEFAPEETDAVAFVCPCHVGCFKLDGNLSTHNPEGEAYSNPAPRGMDDLVGFIQKGKLRVFWRTFRQGVPEAEKQVAG